MHHDFLRNWTVIFVSHEVCVMRPFHLVNNHDYEIFTANFPRVSYILWIVWAPRMVSLSVWITLYFSYIKAINSLIHVFQTNVLLCNWLFFFIEKYRLPEAAKLLLHCFSRIVSSRDIFLKVLFLMKMTI